MDKITLETPIGQLWGVGENYVKRLKKLGIETVEDLIYHKPSRYEDWSLISPISKVQAGEKVTVVGKLMTIQPITSKYGKSLQIARVMDENREIQVVWFNQRYLINTMRVGQWYSLAGKAEEFNGQLSLVAPEWEKINQISGTQNKSSMESSLVHTGRLVPVYPETYGVSSKWLRSRINMALEKVLPVEDWQNLEVYRLSFRPSDKERGEGEKSQTFEDFSSSRAKLSEGRNDNLIDLTTALYQIHFPDSMEMAEKAQKRLAHDELLILHLENLERRGEWKKNRTAVRIQNSESEIRNFIINLPFKLTKAQFRVIDEIVEDLTRDKPMNRLLEGDVGSGKTVVAAAGIYLTVKAGMQTALMAPTEVLAQQHYEVLKNLLGNSESSRSLPEKEKNVETRSIASQRRQIKVVLQTGRKKFVKKGEDEPFDVIVGTHALLSETINFDKLGLVVIDEQHRFGVEQRAKLVNKGLAPHVLSMTATPIPRTVALTMYGELDLSVLDEMPPGRMPVKTWLVPNGKREAAYEWIKEQILSTDSAIRDPNKNTEYRIQETEERRQSTGDRGKNTRNLKLTTRNQVFIVCPFIEPSESLATVKAAREEFEKLKQVFNDLELNLLHGKLKGKEKDKVIEKFRTGKTDILVSTPVVEVGVDIPDASIMLIEAAERFGLSQLHQLRGRVGRGGQQAYCLLFTESESDKTTQRLRALESVGSGLALAELDLKMRGPGQIYGTSQHGFADLRFADYNDIQLIQKTRILAQNLYPQLNKFTGLRKKVKEGRIAYIEPN